MGVFEGGGGLFRFFNYKEIKMQPINSASSSLVPLQPTGLFSVLPNEVISSILSRLSFEDLAAMMRADRYHHAVVPIHTRIATLLTIYKCPPSLIVEESLLNKLDVLANRVEWVPIIGYLCSVPRAVGGGVATIGFRLAQGVACLQAYSADTQEAREEHSKQQLFYEEQALRGWTNVLTGFTNSCPFLGVLSTWSSPGPQFYFIRDLCISRIKVAIVAFRWIKYTQAHVIPLLPDNDRIYLNIPSESTQKLDDILLVEMHKWMQAPSEILYPNPHYFDWIKKGEEQTLPTTKLILDSAASLVHLFKNLKLNPEC